MSCSDAIDVVTRCHVGREVYTMWTKQS